MLLKQIWDNAVTPEEVTRLPRMAELLGAATWEQIDDSGNFPLDYDFDEFQQGGGHLFPPLRKTLKS